MTRYLWQVLDARGLVFLTRTSGPQELWYVAEALVEAAPGWQIEIWPVAS